MTLAIGLFILGAIIFIHELGHFLVGKFVGLRIISFAIGMGPKIWCRRIGDTVYSIRILPIGGYVRTNAAMDKEDEKPGVLNSIQRFLAPIEEEEQKYVAELMQSGEYGVNLLSPTKSAAVILAGSAFNILSAFIAGFIYILVAESKYQYEPGTAVGPISSTGVAAKAGFQEGDRIVSINDKPVHRWPSILYQMIHSESKEFNFQVARRADGIEQQHSFQIRAKFPYNPKDYLRELAFYEEVFQYKFSKVSVPVSSALTTSARAVGAEMLNYGLIFIGRAEVEKRGRTNEEQSAGPGLVAATNEIGLQASASLRMFVSIFISISVGIALFNLLPLPALDGGQFFILLIEQIKGVKITFQSKLVMNQFGFAIMLLLVLFTTLADFAKTYRWM